MKGFTLIPFPLDSLTYAASGSFTIPLNKLPKQYMGKLAHLVKITYSAEIDPTFSTAPTTVGTNNLVTQCDVVVGGRVLFRGGFNALRMKERLSAGRSRVPNTTAATSTNLRYVRRTWHAGPPHFEGSPTDWVIPTGLLEDAVISGRFGAITDVSADVTAMTATVQVTAWLCLLDELRIPPAYEFTEASPGQADYLIPGRCLVESLALLKATGVSGYGAISAGDFGNVVVSVGEGDIVPGIDAEELTFGFIDDFAAGQIDAVQGEQRDSTYDVNSNFVNIASVTALAATTADLNPVVWAPPGARISKLHKAESSIRVRWNGSDSTIGMLIGRILEQPPATVAALTAKALGRLNLKDRAAKIKTLSKQPYGKGPRPEFMPWAIKVQ